MSGSPTRRVFFLAPQTPSVDSGIPPHGSGAHVAATLAGLRSSFDVLPIFADDEAGSSGSAASRARRLVPPRVRGLRHDILTIAKDRELGQRALAAASEFEPDIVYARNEYLAGSATRVARALGVPLVLEVNGILAADARTIYRSLAEPAGRWVERRKLAAADAIVTVSVGLADRLAELGASRRRITVVPNAVPDGRLASAPRRAGTSVVIGWVGHLMNWHAEALLMLADAAPEVLQLVPEARFKIVGDGPRLPDVRARVDRRGASAAFQFVGAVPYERVPDALSDVDFGVIPDVFDYAFPVKLVELGAAGLAVAAPASKDLDAMLQPGLEYHPFTRFDSQALADAIVALARDTTLRDRLAAGLHAAVAARFTWSATGVQLQRVVSQLLDPG